MSQYFISYTNSDQPWAEWIAWQIEEEGHKAVIQAWDFSPGSNFVLKMQEACTSSDATIVVLSKEYLKKGFPASEWAAAFVQDPTGKKRVLMPIRVDNVKPNGLLSTIVYIDLFNEIDGKNARNKLLKGILKGRGKPMEAPTFPKSSEKNNVPCFPGVPENKNDRLDGSQEETEIEIRINQDFSKFSPFEQEKILKAVQELLHIDYDIKVTKVKRGSVLLTVKLRRKDALQLYILNFIGKLGKLNSYGVTNVYLKDLDQMKIDDIIEEYNELQEHPPIAGNLERGKIVFIDQGANYGIIRRSLGGYLKFSMPKHEGSIGLGKRVSINWDQYKSDDFFLR
ncbi:MAG: toll/interleukin-1 receptor domain-containing protein [Desulfobacteraceae bacterium]|nr:toll/interleukin-1 receptor domain-containing protein [Desulfobacteraceae bacterium]